jgi:dihydrofolate reductase
MEIAIVVAFANNQVIGKDNKLLWHLPADMRFFKNLTSGHIIIMGRKTYDSIGKPLPNRENIVISRDEKLSIEGCIVVNSLEKAIEKAKEINESLSKENKKTAFVIGGEQIYKLAIGLAHKLYITKIKANFEGDAFFPKFDFDNWEITEKIDHKKDEKNQFDYHFLTYQAITN